MTFRSLLMLTHLLLATSTLLVAALPVSHARADSASEIDAQVDAALARFRKQIEGADEFLKAAKGVLVVPDVKKVGFVVGGQWGQGALRINGKTVEYYKMDAGSAGFQAGYQQADFVFLFLTAGALQKFRESQGWSGGAESGITVVEKSMGLSADTLKSSKPVTAFVFGKKGLMGGWSAKGTKFTRFIPED